MCGYVYVYVCIHTHTRTHTHTHTHIHTHTHARTHIHAHTHTYTHTHTHTHIHPQPYHSSVSTPYKGDYIELSQVEKWQKIKTHATIQDTPCFADFINKVNRKDGNVGAITQSRAIIMQDYAICNMFRYCWKCMCT